MSDVKKVQVDLGNLYTQQKGVRDALRRGIKRVAFIGSVQVGKSYLGARILLEQVMTNNNPDSNLMVSISPNHIMGRVMRREFELLMQQSAPELWKIVSKTRKQTPIPTYTFPNGKQVEFHSVDNPDTIRGLRPAFILCDEAAYFTEEAWLVVEGRTTQTGAAILITTTPRGKRHWLFRHVFVKAAPPSSKHHDPRQYDPERFYMQVATIYDNPYIPEDEVIAKIKAYGGENSLWAQQELFGEFVDYEGLVYNTFNEDTMTVDTEKVPNAWTFDYVSAGVDFGWTDPSVSIVVGLKNGVWWIFKEFYKANVDIEKFGAALANQREGARLMRFWADSADPGRIDYYMRAGLPMYPVQKPRIHQRIQYLNSLFAQGRVVISRECHHLIHELSTYQWPDKDKLTGKSEENVKPIGPDHALDALAYVLWMERKLLATTSPSWGDSPDWGNPFDPNAKMPKAPKASMTAGYFDD